MVYKRERSREEKGVVDEGRGVRSDVWCMRGEGYEEVWCTRGEGV